MSTKDAVRFETLATETSSTDPIHHLDYTKETGKRAVYEEFEFHPRTGGVDVVNASHGADAAEDHQYTVDVDGGVPVGCSCPAKEYHCDADEACKHMVAVALARPVCEVATDGGIVVADDGAELLTDDDDEDADECDCDNLDGELVCFECYSTEGDE